ncbi:MAG: hypothetical protein RLY86_1327 [Pseudomonadota bacterium]|jgi:fimbrial chaperone protein
MRALSPRQLSRILLLAALPWIANPAAAFEFGPARAELPAEQAAPAQTYSITNTQGRMIAVQVEVFERTADLDGEEVRRDAGEDFVIVPMQMVLEPGASQTIQVRYLSDGAAAQERAFRVVARQIPVDFTGSQTEGLLVNMNFIYEAALYITPARARPQVDVIRAEPFVDPEGKRHLAVHVRNSGGRRANIREVDLRIGAGDRLEPVAPDLIAPMQGALLLAGMERRFLLPWPPTLDGGPIRAEGTVGLIEF